MAQTVKLKRSAVAGNVPSTSNLELGELAINTNDGKIYFEKNDGSPSIETILTTNSQTTGSIEVTGNIVGNFVEIINVTVVDDGGNKYAFEGATTPDFTVSEGKTYRFNLSDSSLGSHPFRLSTTEDGSHNGGSAYTTGVTVVGTQGSAGAYLDLQVTKATVNHLYYYCTAHGSMGNDGKILKNDLTNLHKLTVSGDITARRYIVSSSVTNITTQQMSGSTQFGDDIADTHQFTGSLKVTGSLNVESGRILEQGSSVIDHATAMSIVFGG